MKRLISISVFIFANLIYSQDSANQQTVFPNGISAVYGLGKFSVRDEYISKEKYSGTLPNFQVNWLRFHNNYGYALSLEYRGSTKIKNNNVSANIYQFTLNQGFLYPMTKMSLFTSDIFVFIGPSTELYFYYNKQNIAVSGFDYAQSFAAMFSVGINSEIIYPLRKNLQAEGSLRLSILSLGFRIVDSEEDDSTPVKLLTPLSGTNASFKIGMRYYLFENLSLKLAYKLHLTRISAWNPLLSASDNAIISMAYEF